MDKKKITYENLIYVFEGEGDCPIINLVQEVAGSIYDLKGEIDPDKALGLTVRQQTVAFALGYAIAKMFDVVEEEALQTLDQIKQLIRESGIFPYLPVESTKSLNTYSVNTAPDPSTP